MSGARLLGAALRTALRRTARPSSSIAGARKKSPGGGGTVRVLAYHAVRDLEGDPVLASYGTPPDELRKQLTALRRCGFRFLSGSELADGLRARRLPRRAVVITFDDCTRDLLDAAAPVLRELGVPAVAFAVTALVGCTNRWDQSRGGAALTLADGRELRQLCASSVEIGAHSRTHPNLVELDDVAVRDEVDGSMAAIASLGLPPARLFAYPYGSHDTRVEAHVRRSVELAFTFTAGVVREGSDPMRIPRIPVLREDSGPRFLLKVLLAGRLGRVYRLAPRRWPVLHRCRDRHAASAGLGCQRNSRR